LKQSVLAELTQQSDKQLRLSTTLLPGTKCVLPNIQSAVFLILGLEHWAVVGRLGQFGLKPVLVLHFHRVTDGRVPAARQLCCLAIVLS